MNGNEGVQVSLVDWDYVCTLMQGRGLGIWHPGIFNQEMLGKWLPIYALKDDFYGGWVEYKFGSGYRGLVY